MKYSSIIILFLLSTIVASAQDQIISDTIVSSEEVREEERFRKMSINMSPLIFQLVPFKQGDVRTGPFGFAYAWGFGPHAFRGGLGFNIDPFGDSNTYGLLRVGYEYNRTVKEKWVFNSSYDLWMGGGGFNIPNTNNNGAVLGFALGLGAQYFINEHIFIATESNLFIGFSDFIVVQVVPPISIFLGIKI